MNKPSKDDVARLIKGRPTKSRVGSRAVSHRLRIYEINELELAKKSGYLVVDLKTRNALKNSWYLWCNATNKLCLYLAKIENSENLLTIQHAPWISQSTLDKIRATFKEKFNLIEISNGLNLEYRIEIKNMELTLADILSR